MLRLYLSTSTCAGVDEENDPTSPLEVVLKDSYHIKFHLDYLSYVIAAIRYYNALRSCSGFGMFHIHLGFYACALLCCRKLSTISQGS